MANKVVTVKIERLAHDGAGYATYEGVPLHVHGMMPGEEGVVEVRRKHGMYVGILKEIILASPSRKIPDELHYLSCSPWQVMEYPLQAEEKFTVIKELFGYYADAPKSEFVTANQFYGYRTKIEFSFTDREGGVPLPLSLAFHARGGGSLRLQLPEGCLLASENMNRAALLITEKLRALGYQSRDLKTLIIRESKSTGKLIALLFAKSETIAKFPVDDIPHLAGFIVFHSTEKSPASVPTKELWRFGESMLEERVGGLHLGYSWDSFFQNNVPVFENALDAIRGAIAPGARIIELFAGVGTIGIALAHQALHVHGIEVVPAAVAFAKKNAEINGLTNYVAECIPAEKMDARLLEKKDVLVIDPPRAGLHPKTIQMIREKMPPQIIYLSCNPETQARDYSALEELYKIDSITGFDFYPQTPHLESLLCLSLRNK